MSTEAKVGAFTMAGIVLFIAVAMLLSNFSFHREKGYTLYAGFSQVSGINPQAQVALSGVPVGTVKSVRNEGGGVTVEMNVQDKTKIPRGSHVTIGSSGVMGDKFINITPAPDVGDYLQNGDYLIAEDEAGIDTLMSGASKTLDQVQGLVENLNKIAGDPKFQGSIIQMAANLRDATAHISGMMAGLESMVNHNQGNVNAMLTNLKNMSASLDRSADGVEAMVNNLQTVGADPQTAENIKLTLQNIQDASGRIQHMAANLDKSLGDPQTAADLTATIQKAKKISDRAGNLMGKVENIQVKPSAAISYSGAKNDWVTDAMLDIEREGRLLRLGVEDIGDASHVDAQVGKSFRDGRFGVRGGVIDGEVGAGLDAFAGRSIFSVDGYDLNDFRWRMTGQYNLNDSGTWLFGRWTDISRKDDRAAYFGIRQEF